MNKATAASAPLLPGQKPPSILMLRLIAAFALLKSLSFVVVAGVMFTIFKHPNEDTITMLLSWVNFDTEFFTKILTESLNIPKTTQKLVIGGSIFYAMLYMTEATGLWLDKTWAEWLTLIGSFVPLPYELYILYQQISYEKSALLIINIAVIIYLARRLKCKRAQRLRRLERLHAPGPLAPSNLPSSG